MKKPASIRRRASEKFAINQGRTPNYQERQFRFGIKQDLESVHLCKRQDLFDTIPRTILNVEPP